MWGKILFSPCMFVCLCCHDVCQDDLAMKDWCQVYSRGCLVEQVMFHALVAASMTSPGHKVGQIFKSMYLHQYFSYRVDQKLKILEMLVAILLVYPTSGINSGKKKFVATSKWRPFWNMKCSFILTSDLKRSSQSMQKKSIFHGDDIIDDVAGWP